MTVSPRLVSPMDGGGIPLGWVVEAENENNQEANLGKIYEMGRRADAMDDDAIPLEVEGETEDLTADENPNPAPRMASAHCGRCRIRFGFSEKRDRNGNHIVCP